MKRYSIPAMILVLAALLLTGCGRKKQEPTTAPTTMPTVAPTTAPTTRPTTAPTTAPTTMPTNPMPEGTEGGNGDMNGNGGMDGNGDSILPGGTEGSQGAGDSQRSRRIMPRNS